MHAVAALIITMANLALVAAPNEPTELPAFKDFMVIGDVANRGRRADHTDAVESLIVTDNFTPPSAGDTIELPDGETRTWLARAANDEGVIEDPALRGGYAWTTITVPEARDAILDARGHSMVYVNGLPRAGDPYSAGNLKLPVRLVEGDNEFLFRVGRGKLRARLLDVPRTDDGETRSLAFMNIDDTRPDLVVEQPVDTLAGLVVANFTDDWTPKARIIARSETGIETISVVSSIPPGSIRKLPVRLISERPMSTGDLEFTIELVDTRNREVLDQRPLVLKVLEPGNTRRVTFKSNIDGSVQFYGLTPAITTPESIGRPGIIMTLHGAGVDARRQAGCYSPKSFAHVVAPTNRRPFGFDWEDWGRLDAYEVLAHAKQSLKTDPLRQWLTGHSMGGHGTWQVAAHKPHLFAAIAPSAGWISFDSYTGAPPEPTDDIGRMLARAGSPSDTLKLKENLDDLGIYVLHGDADDNVPVEQARQMRKELSEHPDFAYHEQEGAGHWWGNQCVDWPELIEFLKDRTLTADLKNQTQFTTVSPGISGRSDWFEISSQLRHLEPSRIEVDRDPELKTLKLRTENVAQLRLRPNLHDASWTFEIDGQVMELSPTYRIYLNYGTPTFNLKDGKWRESMGDHPNYKSRARYGPFKEAFQNNMVFVPGTVGTDEESRINIAKAIFDAETFLYRGNGSVEIIPDVEFDPEQHEKRNVILYGNSYNNQAWARVLPDSRLHVDRNGVSIGDYRIDGDDLAILAIQPDLRYSNTSVGIVSGTGPRGMRLTEQLPYFVSGVHYPDVTVIDVEMLQKGEEGIVATGFLDEKWGMDDAEIIFRKAPYPADPANLSPAQLRERNRPKTFQFEP